MKDNRKHIINELNRSPNKCKIPPRSDSEIYKLLTELATIATGTCQTKQIIRKHIGQDGIRQLTLKFPGKLADLYQKAVAKFRRERPEAFIMTPTERYLQHAIQEATKKPYLTSVLVGKHVQDGYFPQHRLGIEIDGPIHNAEFKMRKDNRRDDNLISKRLRIYVLTIPNDDIMRGVSLVRSCLLGTPRIHPRHVRWAWIKIHAFTVSKHFQLNQLESYFELNLRGLLCAIGKRTARKYKNR